MVTPVANRNDAGGFWRWLALISLIAAIALGWQAQRAGGFVDLWLTPDQQGRRAYESLEFKDAYERFEDSAWQGVAAYKAGMYAESAAAFGRIPTAEAFFNRGNAFMKSREYRKAIAAYEQAVVEAPGWLEATQNLELATYTLAYIERTREESDQGKASLGADKVVFDNNEQRGGEMEMTEGSTIELDSAEKWMRSVNTQTRDFLQTRFSIEAGRQEPP